MKTVEVTPGFFHEGEGRTWVGMSVNRVGEDLIVCLFNEAGHIGAVAVADFCEKEHQASVSVITRPGHREDVTASEAARRLCKALERPVCVIAGIHLDNITKEELAGIVENCEKLTDTLISGHAPQVSIGASQYCF